MPVTHYVWDELSDNVLKEVNDTVATVAEYTNEPGQFGELISQRRDSTDNYFHFDAQGSTRQLTSDDETETDSYSYSAFGETVAISGSTDNPYRYNGAVGYYTDQETNVTYVRMRMYQPTVGRWLSEDALGVNTYRPNPYAYADNQPLNMTDPSGLLAVWLAGGIVKYARPGTKNDLPDYQFRVQYTEGYSNGFIMAQLEYETKHMVGTPADTNCRLETDKWTRCEWFQLDGGGTTPTRSVPIIRRGSWTTGTVDIHLISASLAPANLCELYLTAKIKYGNAFLLGPRIPQIRTNWFGSCHESAWVHGKGPWGTDAWVPEPNTYEELSLFSPPSNIYLGSSTKNWGYEYEYRKGDGCCCGVATIKDDVSFTGIKGV